MLKIQYGYVNGIIETGYKVRYKELVDKIEPEKDGIIIYKFSGYGLPDKDILGKNKGENRFIL